MDMEKTKYEGTVEYFRLSDKTHSDPSPFSKRKIPIVSVGIRNEQEGLREFELPINVPNDLFSVRLFEGELIGQRASYERRYESGAGGSGPIWNFQVHSGKFQGVNYTLDEVVDF